MAAELLDGKRLAEEELDGLRDRVDALKKRGVTPGLAVVLVGDDPASQTYVRNKGKACEKAGVYSRTIILPADTRQSHLEKLIDELNRDPEIDGILVQLPLPVGLDEQRILARISPEKDADGFHVLNAGKLLTGQATVLPCTPKGVIAMLKAANVPIEGKHAVVVGRSNIVGKPAALLLLRENATVTICHSKTPDLASMTRQADILVAAVGRANVITADMIKPSAAVVDVGINRVNGRLVGDVDFERAFKVAGWISPVPGGVGRMTVAMLIDNVVELAAARRGRA
ncbi:MAG: bifunctional methylenetetrahydrofolate dehydrogenase/methenyltetrahydrofolate cyclohydrolase FolD [Clostridia bacterium]|nr:bifunctional methylenetetrahydrofolate dehydrogenase/methenyltetrahydrofolate cyclohydrolase FolD [Clostridia bacterium]